MAQATAVSWRRGVLPWLGVLGEGRTMARHGSPILLFAEWSVWAAAVPDPGEPAPGTPPTFTRSHGCRHPNLPVRSPLRSIEPVQPVDGGAAYILHRGAAGWMLASFSRYCHGGQLIARPAGQPTPPIGQLRVPHPPARPRRDWRQLRPSSRRRGLCLRPRGGPFKWLLSQGRRH